MRALLLAAAASLLLAAPAVAAPQWLQPVTVGGPSDTNVTGDIAVAPDGTTVVAWTEVVGGFTRARARVRRPGEGFGPVHELSPPDRNADSPSVGVDQQGNFTAAWIVDTQVHAAMLPAGATAFGPVETVAAPAGGAFSPAVGAGGNGVAVIAYLEDGAVNAAIRPSRDAEFAPGAPISTNLASNYDVAVDDAGNAVAVWSREVVGGTNVVEVAERAAGAGFGPSTPISSTTPSHKSTRPSLALAGNGRALVAWTFQSGSGPLEVRFNERPSGGFWLGTPPVASKPGEQAESPSVAFTAGGSVVGAWEADPGSGTKLVQAALHEPDGGFTGHRNFASTSSSVPFVTGNRRGDAFVTWNGTMGEGVFAVRRAAGGEFGSVDTVALGTQGSAMPTINLNLRQVAVDDQGNGAAAWLKETNPGGVFQYSIEAGFYDAAAPSLDAVSVPASGAPGSPIGMAATASDRLSTPTIAWSFGDGATASGPAVSHAYGAPGAYSVTITATDGAGNVTSTSRSVVVIAPGVAAQKRVNSRVKPIWGVAGKRIYLLRMRVERVPRGGKVELRCKGRKCPYKRISSKKRRKGVVTLVKEIKARKAVGKKQRTFRAGQVLELRVTAPGHIGKVVRYRLRKGRIPSGQTLCLPVGASKPRKSC
jgi:chitodextrinase